MISTLHTRCSQYWGKSCFPWCVPLTQHWFPVCVCVCLRSIRVWQPSVGQRSVPDPLLRVLEATGSFYFSLLLLCVTVGSAAAHTLASSILPLLSCLFYLFCYFLFSLFLCCVVVCMYLSVWFVTACAHISVWVCVFVSICIRFWMSVYICVYICVCVCVSSLLSWLQFLCRQMQLLDRAA